MELNATILIQFAVFFTLLAWLSPVLFDPFLELFAEREKRIVGASDEAKKLAGSAEERTALIVQRTAAAQAEARGVLTSLRARAQEREKEIIAAAREKATARLEEARADLFEAGEEARRSLKNDAKTISADIVKKVLGRAA